jgi:hypothetical protein
LTQVVLHAPDDALVDYKTFLNILNRPDGFKPAGTPGAFLLRRMGGWYLICGRGVCSWIPGV